MAMAKNDPLKVQGSDPCRAIDERVRSFVSEMQSYAFFYDRICFSCAEALNPPHYKRGSPVFCEANATSADRARVPVQSVMYPSIYNAK